MTDMAARNIHDLSKMTVKQINAESSKPWYGADGASRLEHELLARISYR